MKRLISILFATAALAAALQPLAARAAEPIWVSAALIFVGGEVVDSKVFGDKTLEKCNQMKAVIAKSVMSTAASRGEDVELWMSDCIQVAPPKKTLKKERDS